jgi:exosortase A
MMASIAANTNDIKTAGVVSALLRSPVLTLVFAVAVEIALMWPTLTGMARTWLESSAYHHGLAAAPISIWLVVRSHAWRVRAPHPSRVGVGLAAIAACAWLFGRAANVEIVAQFALIGVLIATFIAIFGLRLARSSAFALSFLIFMVPFGQSLTPTLQSAAAGVVTSALNLVGVATIRDGNMLTTSAGAFEMAQACSGLRFLIATIMTTLVLGELAFRTWRGKMAFVAAAVAIAIIANWSRAFLIVALVTLTDRRWGVGIEHVLLGWVFYSVLILGLVGFARRHARTDPAPSPPPSRLSSASISLAPAIGVLAIVAGAALYQQVVVNAADDDVAGATPPELSAMGWRSAEPFSSWRAAAEHADSAVVTAYRTQVAAVQVTNAFFTHDRAGAEIGNSDLRAADGVQWRLVRSSPVDVSIHGDEFGARIELIENQNRQRLAVVTAHWLGDKIYASRARLKFDLGLQKLRGVHQAGGAIFFATSADAASADEVLRDFIASAEFSRSSSTLLPETGD